MRHQRPYGPGDLAELDERLLSRAHAVIALQEVHAGNRHPDVIGLRHDVDDNRGAFENAVRLADWEANRGYRATYFLLHTADYWHSTSFWPGVERISRAGHEIGIHTNAIADALRTSRDPDTTLQAALVELRSHGYPTRGVVGHGDSLCRAAGFANDEQFLECARPKSGFATRELEHDGNHVTLAPRPLSDFGLTYEAVRLGRGYAQSDSGGRWLFPFDNTVESFTASLTGPAAAAAIGQLHLLIHPDWWGEALHHHRPSRRNP